MALTAHDIQRTAKLARLGLTETETESTLEKLNAVLELIDHMQTVETEGVAPMSHPLDLTQTLRADAVTESNQREKLQAIAPAAADGLYLVPRVVE